MDDQIERSNAHRSAVINTRPGPARPGQVRSGPVRPGQARSAATANRIRHLQYKTTYIEEIEPSDVQYLYSSVRFDRRRFYYRITPLAHQDTGT